MAVFNRPDGRLLAAGREVQGIPVFTFLRGTAILDAGKTATRDGFGKQATRAVAVAA